MHGTEEASKIWVVEVSTIEYSHYSKELMHLFLVTLYLIRRFTKRQVPQGGVYGGLVILVHPRPMVREGSLTTGKRSFAVSLELCRQLSIRADGIGSYAISRGKS